MIQSLWPLYHSNPYVGSERNRIVGEKLGNKDKREKKKKRKKNQLMISKPLNLMDKKKNSMVQGETCFTLLLS